MKKAVFFILLCIASLPAFTQTKPATDNNKVVKEQLSFRLIENADKTFGYDIYKAGKLFVHQPTIPGRPGNSGFKTRADAEKVAKLVMNKIKKGIIPPTVEEKELQQLKI